jgi:hypothetical protein
MSWSNISVLHRSRRQAHHSPRASEHHDGRVQMDQKIHFVPCSTRLTRLFNQVSTSDIGPDRTIMRSESFAPLQTYSIESNSRASHVFFLSFFSFRSPLSPSPAAVLLLRLTRQPLNCFTTSVANLGTPSYVKTEILPINYFTAGTLPPPLHSSSIASLLIQICTTSYRSTRRLYCTSRRNQRDLTFSSDFPSLDREESGSIMDQHIQTRVGENFRNQEEDQEGENARRRIWNYSSDEIVQENEPGFS